MGEHEGISFFGVVHRTIWFDHYTIGRECGFENNIEPLRGQACMKWRVWWVSCNHFIDGYIRKAIERFGFKHGSRDTWIESRDKDISTFPHGYWWQLGRWNVLRTDNEWWFNEWRKVSSQSVFWQSSTKISTVIGKLMGSALGLEVEVRLAGTLRRFRLSCSLEQWRI